MAKKKEPTKEDLEIEKFIEKLEKSPYLGPFSPGQKELIRRMEKEKRRKEEEARKSMMSEKLSPKDEARIEDMERRYKHRIYDFKYGTFNPKLFAIRFVQFFVVVWIIGYIFQERDRARAERKLAEEIARSKEYSRREAEAKAYRNAQESFRVVQDFYPNRLPTDRKNTPRTETVKIRPVAHGKYPGEYTIEYHDASKGTVSPEDLLDQIDQEDILDYMDGNID